MRLPLLIVHALLALLLAMGAGRVVAQAPAEEPRFDILEFVVEGNSVLPPPEIEAAVMPHLGRGRQIRDVENARKALEDLYQRLGYQTVFVDVPEQRITAGVVRLRVLEGRVERLRITGSRYFTHGEIRAATPSLAAGAVPDFNAVQTELASLNRTRDRAVTPVLRQGRTPGTVEVELAVRDDLPLHGELELNNRSSAFTSETRLLAGVRWDNLWQRQHSFGLQLQSSPEATDEVKVLVANYLWRFTDSADAVALYAVRSDSKVALVGSSTVLGKATIAGARRVIALPGSPSRFHSMTLGADYKRFGQTNIATATEQADVLPPLDYVPLSWNYASTGFEPGRSLAWGLTFAGAPAGVLGNRDAEFAGRRALARAGWTVLKFDVTLEQAFGPAVSVWSRIEGQWSSDPLISNEQLTVGGAESVRGYRESELAGDRGGRGSLELRWSPWRPAPAVAGAPADTPRPLLADLSLYALLDIGGVETVEPQGPQVVRRWIGGAGLGLRWAGGGWRAQLDAARALNPGGSGTSGPITEKGDWRAHARLALEF
jgi:hemolysin activation/secretion protein